MIVANKYDQISNSSIANDQGYVGFENMTSLAN